MNTIETILDKMYKTEIYRDTIYHNNKLMNPIITLKLYKTDLYITVQLKRLDKCFQLNISSDISKPINKVRVETLIGILKSERKYTESNLIVLIDSIDMSINNNLTLSATEIVKLIMVSQNRTMITMSELDKYVDKFIAVLPDFVTPIRLFDDIFVIYRNRKFSLTIKDPLSLGSIPIENDDLMCVGISNHRNFFTAFEKSIIKQSILGDS